MTFKDLKKRVSLETAQQQSKLFERAHNKPFWIWFGGFIYGYDNNYWARDRESKILSTISDYKVRYIEDKYKALTKGRIRSLWKIQEQSLKNVFGYTSITDYKCSNEIKESLRYSFYSASYNAYKHAYRLWPAHDHKNNIDITLYIPSLTHKHIRKQRKYVPTDEKSLPQS